MSSDVLAVGFVNLTVGFISGMYIACLHPLVVQKWAEARKAKESLAGMRNAIQDMQAIIRKAKK